MITSGLNITTTGAMEFTPPVIHFGAAIRTYRLHFKTTLAKPTDPENRSAPQFNFLDTASAIMVASCLKTKESNTKE